MCDRFAESEPRAEFTNQDRAAVGRNARTLEIAFERRIRASSPIVGGWPRYDK